MLAITAMFTIAGTSTAVDRGWIHEGFWVIGMAIAFALLFMAFRTGPTKKDRSRDNNDNDTTY